jgi:hypothetical protein
MADQIREIYKKVRARAIDMRALLRLAIWGFVAATALMGAVLSTYPAIGPQHVKVAIAVPTSPDNGQQTAQPRSPAAPPAPIQEPAVATAPTVPSQEPEIVTISTARRQEPAVAAELAAQTAEIAKETHRLSEAVVALTADRDRLIKRIASIELSLEDLTGSIKRQAAAAAAMAPAAAAATSPAPAPAPPPAITPTPTDQTVVLSLLPPPPHQDPPPPEAAAPTPQPEIAAPPPANPRVANTFTGAATDVESTRGAEFGLDVGGAVNFDGLRTLWTSTQRAKGVSFDGLRPIIAVRENKARGLDLRLIVGPLPSTQAATQMCAALLAARRYCQMTSFEGQPLPLAAPEPERRPVVAQPRSSGPARTQPTPPTPPTHPTRPSTQPTRP